MAAFKDLEKEKEILEETNAKLMIDYKHDLEGLKQSMNLKVSEDKTLFQRIFDEKVDKTRIAESAQQDLEKLLKEYTSKSAE